MKRKTGIPAALVQGRRRFDAFRAGGKRRTPFPPELWSLAADLARDHGVCRTSRALGLDYYSMKEHLEATGRCQAKADFIEILSGPPVSAGGGCTIEIEEPDGSRMRVRVASHPLPDLAAIARAFRGGRS